MSGSSGSRRYGQHQGRGSVGQLVAPQMKRTANPSPINVAPTSTPFTRSVPQRRPKLHASVPSVPGGQEQATCWKSGRPLRTSSRSRRPAASPFWRSASHRARLPVSGALNPTKRTFGRPSPRLIVSPSITCTEIGAGAWTVDLAGAATVCSPERFDETLTAAKPMNAQTTIMPGKVEDATLLRFDANGHRIAPSGGCRTLSGEPNDAARGLRPDLGSPINSSADPPRNGLEWVGGPIGWNSLFRAVNRPLEIRTNFGRLAGENAKKPL